MKHFFSAFVFLLLLPLFASSQDVEMVIENATYRHKQRSFRIDVHWLNNSSDTVSVIIPQSNQFKGNLYNFGSFQFVGELQKPYTIDFRQEGTCEGQKDYEPGKFEQKLSHLHPFHVVTVPPGKRSKRIVISLGANHNFCTESQYFALLSYDPQYESLPKKQVKKLEAYQQRFDDIEKEVKAFLVEQDIHTEQRRPSKSLMETILINNQLIEGLAPIKFNTAEVEIVKQ